jgi:SNF2 family DNA or RNA helicase
MLLPYQQKGVDWMRRKEVMALSGSKNPYISKGGMLLDDMGLGKTVQLIALVMCATTDKPTLVVCPASITAQWETEIKRFAQDKYLSTLIYERSLKPTKEQIANKAFVICSYDQTLDGKDNSNVLCEVDFGRMILDEGMCRANLN